MSKPDIIIWATAIVLSILGFTIGYKVAKQNLNAANRHNLHMWKLGYMDAKYWYPEFNPVTDNPYYKKGADDGHRTMQLNDWCD